jgi:hypothetical protein
VGKVADSEQISGDVEHGHQDLDQI